MKKLAGLLAGLMVLCLSCAATAELDVQTFPEPPALYSEVVKPENPLESLFTGAYRVPLTVGEEERSVVVYLAEGFAQVQGFVMIVPASGMTAEQALEEGGWKDVADENELYLMVLEPDSEAYDLSEDGRDMAYITAATALADSRDYWRQPEGRNYMVGYGDGASLALMSAEAKLPDVWAGVATFGDMSLTANQIVNKNGTELPVWMFLQELDEEKALVELFKQYNGCTDEAFSNEYADAIYFPNQQVNDLLLNDQPMSQVRVTVTDDAAALVAERAGVVYDFLSLGTREVGYGAKAMRYTHDLEDWGATVKTLEIGGITRSWIEYVPEKLRYTDESGAPLLVAIHGSALNGEYFAERTQLIKLADEYGFTVVFPTGSISKSIAPVWNTSRDPERWDDVTFIDQMIDNVVQRVAVDTSRVYLYGHSLGGKFTQNLVSFLDGKFAAAAGTGCAFGTAAEQEHTLQTPIYVQFGDRDYTGKADIETSEGVQSFINYFTAYNDCGTIDDLDGAYRMGRFRVYVWENNEGVPMVQYAVPEEMPHTATTDGLMMIYEWLSQFSRGEDGSVGYRTGVYWVQ